MGPSVRPPSFSAPVVGHFLSGLPPAGRQDTYTVTAAAAASDALLYPSLVRWRILEHRPNVLG